MYIRSNEERANVIQLQPEQLVAAAVSSTERESRRGAHKRKETQRDDNNNNNNNDDDNAAVEGAEQNRRLFAICYQRQMSTKQTAINYLRLSEGSATKRNFTNFLLNEANRLKKEKYYKRSII